MVNKKQKTAANNLLENNIALAKEVSYRKQKNAELTNEMQRLRDNLLGKSKWFAETITKYHLISTDLIHYFNETKTSSNSLKCIYIFREIFYIVFIRHRTTFDSSQCQELHHGNRNASSSAVQSTIAV